MVLDINIRKPDIARFRFPVIPWRSAKSPKGLGRSVVFSRLSRVIFLSNLIGLVILITGSLALNQYTHELVQARIQNLQSQANLITSILGDTASGTGVSAELDETRAKDIIARVDLPDGWRVRLHDRAAVIVADSVSLDNTISVTTLGPPGTEPDKPAFSATFWEKVQVVYGHTMHNLPWRVERRNRLRRDFDGDIRTALGGLAAGGERYNAEDDLIVTVTVPVKRVQDVLGAVTLESTDVQDIIASERRALLPFIGLAFLAAVLSSTALTMSLARPLRHLARAAESVAKSNEKRGDIPDYSSRGDEIGYLSVVLKQMTNGLYNRIDDIANFAADVAHEIKNPLTSLRSASDTLRSAKTDEQREKLIKIIQEDVRRMDRLISDISNASKVDANLARESAKTIPVNNILDHMEEFYSQTRSGDGPAVRHLKRHDGHTRDGLFIQAFETPFAQVLRNLIDNAITFSPVDGEVRLKAKAVRKGDKTNVMITVEDDGPGIPPENLNTIFERFYTERPKGAQFGSHSGLGLAICRQIITAHKGEIFAENRIIDEDIVGARFVVTVPQVSSDKHKSPQ